MTARRFGAVLFDLDGVIADTSESHYRAWQRLADEEGIPFDRIRNDALRGVSRERSLELVLGEHRVGAGERAELLDRKNRYYLEELTTSPPQLLPGASEAVQAAQDLGLRTAVVSSSRNAPQVLDALGITDLFDHVATGDSVARAKPAPDLIRHTAHALGVAVHRCLVIEDAASGVEAARAAGAGVIGIGPPDQVGDADLRVDTLADPRVVEMLQTGSRDQASEA